MANGEWRIDIDIMVNKAERGVLRAHMQDLEEDANRFKCECFLI